MSCREKGSSVSRSRKFLALILSCSTACGQEEAAVTVPVPARHQEPKAHPDDGTVQHEEKTELLGSP